jgi:uncharacterized protein
MCSRMRRAGHRRDAAVSEEPLRGEFVFDFSWANAYAQHGLAYYPKLLSAVPFTPVRGPRLLVARLRRGAPRRA